MLSSFILKSFLEDTKKELWKNRTFSIFFLYRDGATLKQGFTLQLLWALRQFISCSFYMLHFNSLGAFFPLFETKFLPPYQLHIQNL
jgi:hypothetical protein